MAFIYLIDSNMKWFRQWTKQSVIGLCKKNEQKFYIKSLAKNLQLIKYCITEKSDWSKVWKVTWATQNLFITLRHTVTSNVKPLNFKEKFASRRKIEKSLLPLWSTKAGRFEKLLGFARSPSIVTRGSISLSCATTPHPSCFSKS